ncbi:MAG: hypothetical protein KDI56_02065 [Xanthomonadales bacterium]|nr:hypothetical protein [Caldilinea sp.]MCB1587666.1 hypothetical protein [Xanthomonadales bacterium]
MRLTAAVRVNSRVPAVKAQGDGFAAEFVDIIGEETVKAARANVLPGIGPDGIGGSGPGPHPHRTLHWDTGALRDSITYRTARRGFMFEAFIETTKDYGLYLEMGWTALSGRHYRYPWLYPAAMMVGEQWLPIAKSTSDRWFSEGDRPTRWAGIRIKSPLSATWQPEEG